jgi:hypothetical protein
MDLGGASPPTAKNSIDFKGIREEEMENEKNKGKKKWRRRWKKILSWFCHAGGGRRRWVEGGRKRWPFWNSIGSKPNNFK